MRIEVGPMNNLRNSDTPVVQDVPVVQDLIENQDISEICEEDQVVERETLKIDLSKKKTTEIQHKFTSFKFPAHLPVLSDIVEDQLKEGNINT